MCLEVRELDWEHLVRMVEQHYDGGRSILVLYRKRETKKDAERESSATSLSVLVPTGEARRLSFLTYLSSKGSQADAVFLLGDCEVTTSSPSRNDFYALAGMATRGEPCGDDRAQ